MMTTIVRSFRNYKTLPTKISVRLGEEVRSGAVRNSEIAQFYTRIFSIKDSEFVVVETTDRMFSATSYSMFANLASYENLLYAIRGAPKYHKNRALKGWSKNLTLA